nr:uncharacterized protein LOC126053600 isoform X2 [Helicoverpa armigera]
MENYTKFKIMGSVKIQMKPNCVPSKFACMEDAAAMEYAEVTEETYLPSEECSSNEFSVDKSILTSLSTSEVEVTSPLKIENCIGEPSSSEFYFIAEEISDFEGTPSVPKDCTSLSMTSAEFRITDYSDQESQSINMEETLQIIRKNIDKEFGQRSLTNTLERIQKNPKFYIGMSKNIDKEFGQRSLTNTLERIQKNPKFYIGMSKNIDKEFGQRSLTNTLERIQKNPKFYIGMSKDYLFLINIIQRNTNIPEEYIYLCLQKIRLNSTFTELGDHFGISKYYAYKLFQKHVLEIAKVLQPFIRNSKKIKNNLPIAFRHKYAKIDYIVDCFEIEIKKPMKAIRQALSWSDYKKANTTTTLKYLISSTPDGMINFISRGYSGKISDVTLVENCKFLENMEPGVSILADRSFKNLQNLFLQKGIELLPSVGSESKLTKTETCTTKEVASLRMHMERVNRRLREFSLFKPHCVIDTNLYKVIDECVIIACALVNIQDIIKI